MNDRIQYLLGQYEKNNCSREEMEELFYYIKRSRGNEGPLKKMVHKIYEDIRKNHPSFTYVDEDGRLVFTEPDDEYVVEENNRRERRKLNKFTWISVIGGVVILSCLIWCVIRIAGRFDNKDTNTLSTVTKKFSQRSENKYLLLSDSTQVWLNASSSLEFSDEFSGTEREVTLKGEAFFKIKKVLGKPFIIHAGKVAAISDGASSCNFKAYPGENEIVVSVNQGKIAVTRDDKQMADLLAGRQVKLGSAEKSVMERNIAIDKIAAWQWGELIYDEVIFKDIVADLERIFNVDITINDKEKELQKISVSLRREIGIAEVLNLVCRQIQSQVNVTDNEYIIEAIPQPVVAPVTPPEI